MYQSSGTEDYATTKDAAPKRRSGLTLCTGVHNSTGPNLTPSQNTTPTYSDSSRSYGSEFSRCTNQNNRTRSKGRPGSQVHSNDEADNLTGPVDSGYRSFNSAHVDKDELLLLRPEGVATPNTTSSAKPMGKQRSFPKSGQSDRDSVVSIKNLPTQLPSPSVWLHNGSPNYFHISTGGTLSHTAMPVLGPHPSSSVQSKYSYGSLSNDNDGATANMYTQRSQQDLLKPATTVTPLTPLHYQLPNVQSSIGNSQRHHQKLYHQQQHQKIDYNITTESSDYSTTPKLHATISSSSPVSERPSYKSIFDTNASSDAGSISFSAALDDRLSAKSDRSISERLDSNHSISLRLHYPDDANGSSAIAADPTCESSWDTDTELSTGQRSRQRLPKAYANYKMGKPLAKIPDGSKYNRFRMPNEARPKTSIASLISVKKSANAKALGTLAAEEIEEEQNVTPFKFFASNRRGKPKTAQPRVKEFSYKSVISKQPLPTVPAVSSAALLEPPSSNSIDRVLTHSHETTTTQRPRTSASIMTPRSNKPLENLNANKAIHSPPLPSPPQHFARGDRRLHKPSPNTYAVAKEGGPKTPPQVFPTALDDPASDEESERRDEGKATKLGFGALLKHKFTNFRTRTRSNSSPKKADNLTSPATPTSASNTDEHRNQGEGFQVTKPHIPILPLTVTTKNNPQTEANDSLHALPALSPITFKRWRNSISSSTEFQCITRNDRVKLGSDSTKLYLR